MTTMNQSTLKTTLTAALTLVLASGACLSANTSTNISTNSTSASVNASISASTNPGIKVANGTMISGSAAPVTLNATQKNTIAQSFNWLSRDAGLLDQTITPTTIFTETIGLKERTNRLTVQVKSESKMFQQIALEQATLRDRNSSIQSNIRGVATAPTKSVTEFRRDAVERRLEATQRIAPSLIEAFDDADMHTLHLPAGVSAEVMAEILMQTGDYEFVSIDWLCYPTAVPNDTLIANQWHHQANRIDTYGAWDYTTGSGEIIAVCDTGVKLNHPDLQSTLVPGFNAVTNTAQVDGGNVNDDFVGHGTFVAGIAAAAGNNGTGVSGIGWDFGVMPVRVSNNTSGTAFLSDILQGARWGAQNGADTSNCSYGGAEDPASLSTGSILRGLGSLLVFASGNDGIANQTKDWATVIIVGASNSSDNFASFSNTGVGIDCIAPGANVYSTRASNNGYSFDTGTSFAAPITAGALMLIRSANPALGPYEIEELLFNTCDDKQAAGEDDQTGFGRINVRRAVEDAIFGPSIVSLPFLDQFNDPTLTQWRNVTGSVATSTNASNEPSGTDSLNLSGTAQVNTIDIRGADFFNQTGVISFYTQHSGTQAGEDLLVEYMGFDSNWYPLTTVASDGIDQSEFVSHMLEVPFLANHNALALRFSTSGDQASDNWYIDDVNLSFFEGNAFPWIDTFESGISLTFNWESSNATTSTDGDNEPSGTLSANLNNTDSMTSHLIDINAAVTELYFQAYIQHKGVEAGESLVIEYKDIFDSWAPITTIVSDGIDQTGFELTQLPLPVFAYSPNFRIRITAQGDQADDNWYVDNVAISDTLIVEPDPCPADMNGDGTINFVDVSAFVAAFTANDSSADFNGDGTINFVDVSAFVAAFNAGCP